MRAVAMVLFFLAGVASIWALGFSIWVMHRHTAHLQRWPGSVDRRKSLRGMIAINACSAVLYFFALAWICTH